MPGSVVPEQKGAYLLAPRNRHVDAYAGALSARPCVGRTSSVVLRAKFPRFVTDSSRSRAISCCLLVQRFVNLLTWCEDYTRRGFEGKPQVALVRGSDCAVNPVYS